MVDIVTVASSTSSDTSENLPKGSAFQYLVSTALFGMPNKKNPCKANRSWIRRPDKPIKQATGLILANSAVLITITPWTRSGSNSSVGAWTRF